MPQDVTSQVDVSYLVDATQADANDVKIPVQDLIGVINDILNGVQQHELITLVGKLQHTSLANEIQLRIRGNASQSANIFEVQNSAGTALLTVSPTGEIFPVGTTEAGLANRTTYLGETISADFETTVGTLSSYAGAPFVGTPNTANFSSVPSFCLFRAGTGATDRLFAYETISRTSAQSFEAFARIHTETNNTIAGIRIDDGTDSNYVEVGLKTAGKGAGLADIVYVTNTGGGGRSETVAISNVLSAQVIAFKIVLSTTSALVYYKLNGFRWAFLSTPLSTTRTWTATRSGFTQFQNSTAASTLCSIDWYGSANL